MKIQIAPSILSADFGHLADEIKRAEAAGVDGFHLDIMDGHFVPNLTMGPMVCQTVRKLTKLPLDAHLMIDNPDLYIDSFAKAGADLITLHLESYHSGDKLSSALKRIKSLNKKTGICINPGTSEKKLEPFLAEADEVLFMSVNPGFSGQSFMPEVLPKITAIRKIYKGDIRVDGGINDKTVKQVIEAGANILVTASYFFGAKDYSAAVQQLLR
ncbi:ribulose-phosphate 3-epimerase [candidate division WOR-1 bacterium RIFOXYA12_FULL_43_27]|uniref:Ribulose-phosphate 3-epimerase n=1 Tax=candidate division WOR-1 bacterium RIFOXYC2_FULL_46_14 TaxID=1802587 RepID=A0A1F4U620_UNCSA|nr:MAG: ribulose-phosphate 3-epimerase [candidate division WOR-1 bacterium RIFOXYA12_FULL_43_27]OGC20562.1 MAG: ribulose-phosphate 3-epimerase [candidate division WOR-1 bacterium RIFOXYB2_FULL_46_45]OGC31701.1 MAG: ribulose-phosphate 3-epimerase [candidate division WOR-1 bacterium RIFOXYA2_FULL_46_56]OGC40404.1 MAG: ribulose-phosphate 3-epimerase [candidate division WOR-1 bacterium RIFOXYC2_FULL_46_14]